MISLVKGITIKLFEVLNSDDELAQNMQGYCNEVLLLYGSTKIAKF